MAKLTKRLVDAAEPREKDYVIWDDELPGFGLRVFASGKRSYVLQYRALGRSRRYTIGLHGVWTAESARQEAKVQLGRVAQGDNPAEERQLDHKAITVKELCTLYLNDLNAGLILGKGGRPKKPTTDRHGHRPHRAAHHPAPGDAPREGPDQGRHQQGPEGHHGRQDASLGQDEEAARQGDRPRRGRNGHANGRSPRHGGFEGRGALLGQLADGLGHAVHLEGS